MCRDERSTEPTPLPLHNNILRAGDDDEAAR